MATGQPYRILHTADWHLGKLLNDRSRDEEHRLFLQWLLETISLHQVDAVLMAGDLFDTAGPSNIALQRYYDFVSALHRMGTCALVVVAGNHDSPSLLEAPRQVLQALNVHVVGHLRENATDRLIPLPNAEKPEVVVAALPFLRDRDLRVGRSGETSEQIRQQLLEGIRERYHETALAAEQLPGAQGLEGPLFGTAVPVIATGHLTVTGARGSESEREIHIGGLGTVPASEFPALFSYIALGHLHRPQRAGADDRIRYSGSPIPLSFSEAADQKEVRILDVADGTIHHRALQIPRFRALLRVSSPLSQVEAALEAALKAARGTMVPDEQAASALEPWLEVTITDSSNAVEINERVQTVATRVGATVLKVVNPATTTAIPAEVGPDGQDEALDLLLEQPAALFRHLLEDAGVEENLREALELTFAELQEITAEEQIS